MISIWWLIPAMFAGTMIGILVIALLSVNEPKGPQKWWDDGSKKN